MILVTFSPNTYATNKFLVLFFVWFFLSFVNASEYGKVQEGEQLHKALYCVCIFAFANKTVGPRKKKKMKKCGIFAQIVSSNQHLVTVSKAETWSMT